LCAYGFIYDAKKRQQLAFLVDTDIDNLDLQTSISITKSSPAENDRVVTISAIRCSTILPKALKFGPLDQKETKYAYLVRLLKKNSGLSCNGMNQ
jgi:hypothetical protein